MRGQDTGIISKLQFWELYLKIEQGFPMLDENSYQVIHRLLQSFVEEHLPIRPCVACHHFREHNGEQCYLAKQRPPIEILMRGCEQWEVQPDIDDNIPF